MNLQKKFVHGNLDAQAVFIQKDAESCALRALVDPSEHHMLTMLLKKVQPENELDCHEVGGPDEPSNAFDAFRRHKKVNV